MTLTISKYQLSKQQHTITLNYTMGENLNHFSHLCRNFFPRIGMRFVKHEMVWLPWQPGPSNKQRPNFWNCKGEMLGSKQLGFLIRLIHQAHLFSQLHLEMEKLKDQAAFGNDSLCKYHSEFITFLSLHTLTSVWC